MSQGPETPRPVPKTSLVGPLVAHGIALLVAILPVCAVELLPLVDYLNHLARMHVVSEHAHSPALQSNYEVSWELVPYLSMDAVVLPLLRVTDLYTAGQIYVVLAFVVTAAGVVSLQVATSGRIEPTSFLVYPVLYSTNLGWGFVPFVFSVGLSLLLLAGLVRLKDAPYLARLGYLSVAFTLMYLSHLVAMGVFALMVACVVTARTRWFSRQFFARGLEVTPAFLPVALLWTQVPPFPGGGSITEGWFDLVTFVPLAFNRDYNMAMIAMIPIFALAYTGWRERFLQVPSPEMWRALLVVGGLTLIVPERLFDVGLVSLRLPYAWLLLLAAGVHVLPGRAPKGMLAVLLAFCLAVYGTRHVQIAQALQTCDAKLVEFREAARTLPKGIALMGVYDLDASDACGNVHWVEHVNTLAVIEADAFVPNLFVKINAIRPTERRDDPGYHVIVPAHIDSFFPGDPGYEETPLKMREWRKNFDYLAYFPGEVTEPIPGTVLEQQGSWFQLLRVQPEP